MNSVHKPLKRLTDNELFGLAHDLSRGLQKKKAGF